MDELVKELVERAGLTEEQAKAAAEVFLRDLQDEDKRKKLVALAASAATIASAVAVGAI